MHYERAPLQKVEAGCGAASAALRCAGASLRYGGAWGVTAVVYAVGRTAEGHRQIGWRMALWPWGER